MLPSMASPDTDPTNPHDLAVDAVQDIQKLATALAHAGAAPQAVQQLTAMADQLNNVVKVLAQGPVPGQGPGGPPPGGPPPGGPPPGGPPPGGPQGGPPPGGPPPGGPPPGAAPGGPPDAASSTIHAATQHLHAAMQASKQAHAQRP